MNQLGISDKVVDLVNNAEQECKEEFIKIDKMCEENSM